MLFAFFRPRLFSSSFARQPARAVSAARVVGSTPGFRPRDGRGCPRVAGTRPRFRASGWPWLVHSGGPPGGLAPTKHQESPHAYPNRYGSSLHQVSLASTVLTRSVPAVIPAYPVLVERVSPPPRPFSRGTDGVRHAPIGVPAPMGSGLEDTPRCGIAARGHGRVAIPVHRVVRHLAHRVQKPCLPRLWAGSPSGCVGKGRKTLTQGELGSASFVPRFEALIRPLGQAPVWGLFGVALAV